MTQVHASVMDDGSWEVSVVYSDSTAATRSGPSLASAYQLAKRCIPEPIVKRSKL